MACIIYAIVLGNMFLMIIAGPHFFSTGLIGRRDSTLNQGGCVYLFSSLHLLLIFCNMIVIDLVLSIVKFFFSRKDGLCTKKNLNTYSECYKL